MLFLSLRSFQKPFQLVRAHTFLRKSAPFDAGRAHGSCIDMSAFFAQHVGFVRPDLQFLTALLAPDFLGLGLSDFYASGATFLKHAPSILPASTAGYDLHHIRLCYRARSSFTTLTICILK